MVLAQVLPHVARARCERWQRCPGTWQPCVLRPVCVRGLCTAVGAGASLSNCSPLAAMQDLLKHTPSSHPDHPLLQDALRISQNFLSGINEEITPRRQSMTVKKGEVSVAGCLGLALPELEDEEPVSGLQLQQIVPEQFGLTQETHCLLGFFTLVRQNPVLRAGHWSGVSGVCALLGLLFLLLSWWVLSRYPFFSPHLASSGSQ